jgi:hypothetical protein
MAFVFHIKFLKCKENYKPRTSFQELQVKMLSENFSNNEKTIAIGKNLIPLEIINQREIKLKKMVEKWKVERREKEEAKNKNFGFTKNSEILNGRFAMFFLLTGILTEIWSSQTIPQQIETMLRIFGFF